jgi:hypothetical protein
LNNTRTLAIVAVLTAATLVAGLTVAATITPSTAFAGGKEGRQEKYMKEGEQDGYKKDRQANGKDKGSNNGNTNTIQILKQKAKASGKFSKVEQNGQNVICTHPSNTSPASTDDAIIGFNPPGSSCTSQSNQPLEVE